MCIVPGRFCIQKHENCNQPFNTHTGIYVFNVVVVQPSSPFQVTERPKVLSEVVACLFLT